MSKSSIDGPFTPRAAAPGCRIRIVPTHGRRFQWCLAPEPVAGSLRGSAEPQTGGKRPGDDNPDDWRSIGNTMASCQLATARSAAATRLSGPGRAGRGRGPDEHIAAAGDVVGGRKPA